MKPVEKSITVPLTPTEAFDLFTADIDQWWPMASHSVGGAGSNVTFANHKGGDITETTSAGENLIWGRIIAHDPGKYLAFTWFPGRSEAEATVVTVSFTKTKTGTRCDLAHGGFEVLGPVADAVSTAYLKGWGLVLGCFDRAARTRHVVFA